MAKNSEIVLASASPRRVELLASACISFDILPSGIEEVEIAGESPIDHVTRLAREKALDVSLKSIGRFFIGADTIVVCSGEIMGKPRDEADAARMLGKLSGVPHDVITGFAVYDKGEDRLHTAAVTTKVYFKRLLNAEITAYIATGCPMDKAGAYAIQGGAAHMVERIEGSYTNVVGLPLCEVVETLREMGAI